MRNTQQADDIADAGKIRIRIRKNERKIDNC